MSHSSKQQKAYSLYLRGVSIPAIATELDVSRRTIERWRRAGNWDRDRNEPDAVEKANHAESNIVDIAQARPKRERQTMNRIDEQLIVEDAIDALSGLLRRENISVNSPGVGSTASALVRLLEYRRKLAPPTVSELAEVAIASGIKPQEFIAELQGQWQLRA